MWDRKKVYYNDTVRGYGFALASFIREWQAATAHLVHNNALFLIIKFPAMIKRPLW